MKILIKNTMILTMDENESIINRGYVLINNNIIEQVSSGDFQGEISDFTIIDGKDYCVMPGLINCHTHAAMTLLRGYGEGLPLMRWLNEKIWPMEAKFKEEHIKLGTELAVIEMLRSGTTTFNDMYFSQNIVKEVVEESGIRAVLGIPLIGDKWEGQLKDACNLADTVINEKNDLIDTMFSPHSPYTLTEEALTEISSEAKRYNKGIHIHISETQDENNIISNKYNMTPCEFLEKCGVFQNKTVAAHCVHLNKNDLDILSNYKVSPVYNPQSNMKLASGVARAGEMIEMGINLCLGTDGTSSNNNLNMFEEMETGAMLQKLYYKDATKFSGKTMIKVSTINGARALNIKNLGSIKKGYKADMILINLNKPNMIPLYDIYSNVVFSANGSEVEYVIISGRIIMKKGNFVKIDEEKIKYDCNKLCSTII
jgi:5-methylthioadenosine/S-adenosylhomocysteine deaminase